MTKRRINLGDKVRDTITGVEGIAIVVADYLNGCRRVAIQPQGTDEKGKPLDDSYTDEQQLEVVEAGAWTPPGLASIPAPASAGGDRPAPRRAADPR